MAFQIRPVPAVLVAVAVAASASMATQSAQAAGRCVLAGGESSMVSDGLAKFMAEAALKNSIKAMGATGSGPVKVTCNQNGLLQYCKATQKACK